MYVEKFSKILFSFSKVLLSFTVFLDLGLCCSLYCRSRRFAIEQQNSQIWNVDNLTENVIQSIKYLHEEGLVDILETSETKVVFRVHFDHLEKVRLTLEEDGAIIHVDVDNVDEYIKSFDNESISRVKRSTGSLPTDSYMKFIEIESYLDSIATTYSNIVTKTSIGISIEGRDIWMISIKSDTVDATKSIFIEGGIHAREWISPAVCLYLVDQLASDSSLLEDVEIRIVPVLNPDGYVYSHTTDRLWRKNRRVNCDGLCVGVDLNRNWDYKFGVSGTSTNPCSGVYKGTSAFSEPETKALSDAMLNTPNVVLVLAIHSFGQLMLYPWQYSATTFPEQADLKQLGDEFTAAVEAVKGTIYKAKSGVKLYPASGLTSDWAYGVLGATYSYTLELRDKGQYGFLLPRRKIQSTREEIWAGFLILLDKVKEE